MISMISSSRSRLRPTRGPKQGTPFPSLYFQSSNYDAAAFPRRLVEEGVGQGGRAGCGQDDRAGHSRIGSGTEARCGKGLGNAGGGERGTH